MIITPITIAFVIALRFVVVLSMYNCLTEVHKLCNHFLVTIFALGTFAYFLNTFFTSVEHDLQNGYRVASLIGLALTYSICWHVIRSLRIKYRGDLCSTKE